MMKKILFIGIILVLTGCGERIIKHMKTKDFEINNNHYINYRYGFEVTIPTNWVFGIEYRKDPGIIRLVTLNRNIKGRLKRTGSIILYYIYQYGNEKEEEVFIKGLKQMEEEEIELGQKKIKNCKDGSFLVLKSINRTNLIKITNNNSIYFWYCTEDLYKEIILKNNNILKEKLIKIYSYEYYIPYRTRKNYYLPLIIGFNEYEDYNFTEEERSNYLQDQMQVIQSFRTFSNFVKDGLPSAKE